MQKRIGTLLLVLLAVVGISLAALAFFKQSPDGQEAAPVETAPQETAAVEETAAPEAYDAQELREWIRRGAEQKCASVSRDISLENTSYQTVKEDLTSAIESLFATDPRFSYDVAWVDRRLDYHKEYVSLTLYYIYSEDQPPYEELPRAETEQELFALLAPNLREGRQYVTFLIHGEVDRAYADHLAEVLANNNVEIAAECHEYQCLRIPEAASGDTYVDIIFNYPVEPGLLDKASAEMRTALDHMAGEIKGSGVTDRRELYAAAARAIMDSTSYEETIQAIIDGKEQALSPEQELLRSGYGAVVGGKTVCIGYTMAFKALCDRLDLPCWVVSGEVPAGLHSWDMIEIDGKTLYCDCTFADTYRDESYLFMTDSDLSARGYVSRYEPICPWAVSS